MTLYFLRHGDADHPHWKGSDDARPLTKSGRREIRKVAKLLRKLGARPDLILSSPLPRALETAKIAAKQIERRVEEEPKLAKSFDAKALAQMIKRHASKELMIVGHEPAFSSVIRELTGARVKLAKGGVARVQMEDGENKLHWLFSPKFAHPKSAAAK